MMDDDLRTLAARDQSPLNELESDIWQKDLDQFSARSSARRLAGWQAGVLAIAVLSSAGFGVLAGSPHGSADVVTPSDLSPDFLILGSRE